jgi:hypothetical protein
MNIVFERHFHVPVHVKDGAKFWAMDFLAPDKIVVEDLVQHMSQFNGWWRRNPL